MLHKVMAYTSLQSGNIKSMAQNITSAVTQNKDGKAAQAKPDSDMTDYDVVEPITPDGYQYV